MGPIRLHTKYLKLRHANCRDEIPLVFPGLPCFLGSTTEELCDKVCVGAGTRHLAGQGGNAGVLGNLDLIKDICSVTAAIWDQPRSRITSLPFLHSPCIILSTASGAHNQHGLGLGYRWLSIWSSPGGLPRRLCAMCRVSESSGWSWLCSVYTHASSEGSPLSLCTNCQHCVTFALSLSVYSTLNFWNILSLMIQ